MKVEVFCILVKSPIHPNPYWIVDPWQQNGAIQGRQLKDHEKTTGEVLHFFSRRCARETMSTIEKYAKDNGRNSECTFSLTKTWLIKQDKQRQR